ncbi:MULTISPECIES: ABC transporter substrate-binding protein [unclassified Leptolyngbya]|uniref:taurine ABC transporter substrate-binding protein n=1 Tax=unclassified Leptolyngbya TaxID=2650499 RepID=UPI001687D37D|nr:MULTISPECIES: ABC transporter substrate-binding protein [unclassified Leptolyngbya]MBD1909179.1 ABC transporter substrate-binding protein [Leptolyngbya sp. FACHB-8]MBD2158440.1 ABC transporter substrate-binding protein [Leptolyngbya sp. FACHB-16]
MRLKRRDVMLGLVGMSLPLIASSCSSKPSETASGSSTASTASPASNGQQPERIRFGYQVYACSDLLAKALKLTDQAFPGVKVEYLRCDSGRDVNTAMAAGGIDFGILGSVAAAVGLSRSIPYNIFYLTDLIGTGEALVVKNDIKTIADIRGKKIATPFSSTSHYSLLSLLKLEGIDQNELTVLDMQAPDMLAAWQRGDIDGGYVWEPSLSKIQKDGGTVLATSADLAKRGAATFDVSIVRQEFVQQYPDVVKQYTEILDEAVQVYRQDPDGAAKAIAPELGVTPEEAKVQMSQFIWLNSKEKEDAQYFGTTDKPGDLAKLLKASADFMVSQKAIPSAPDQETYQKQILYVK